MSQRPMFGLLNILKPAKMTSRDAVNFVQRRVRPHKVGHAGTLDPLATGVLIMGVGPATRLLDYVRAMEKEYRAEFILGKSSDTDDIEGSLSDAPVGHRVPTREEIDSAAASFVGCIEQVPPAYSAIKVGGRRAYQLARAGKCPPLAARPVQIHALAVTDYHYPRLALDVICGGGTYIRALGRDLASQLGTVAIMSQLTRSRIGRFQISEAVPVEQLASQGIGELLLAPELALEEMPQIELTAEEVKALGSGRPVFRDGAPRVGEGAGFHQGRLVTIVKREDRRLVPVRNFRR